MLGHTRPWSGNYTVLRHCFVRSETEASISARGYVAMGFPLLQGRGRLTVWGPGTVGWDAAFSAL